MDYCNIKWEKGLVKIVSPENSELETLTVYSLALGEGEEFISDASNVERALFLIAGKVEASGKKLDPHDTIFHADTKVTIRALNHSRLIIAEAPSPIQQEPLIIRLKEVEKNPTLFRTVGKENYERKVLTFIGVNIRAARLLAGYTWVKSGNWSSFPPHEHGVLMEEVYIFYSLPPPGFGVQLVYEKLDKIKVYVVKENDLVVIPRGYHPNVVSPGSKMKYLWIISARREFVDRKYGAWRIQPEFEKLRL